MRSICAVLLLALSGCVPYPIYKTLQPAAKVTVHDGMSRPIEGARVSLIANAYPYGWEKFRETVQTDSQGIAKFESRREWRLESFMIHGAEVYFWNWCIDKPGFVTFASNDRSADAFSGEATIVLAEGTTAPCPAPYQ